MTIFIQGTSGNDTVFGTSADEGIFAQGGSDFVDAGAGNDTVGGAAGNDTLLGGDGNDDIFGASGNDSIVGGAGADDLFGGAGNDTIESGSGNDTLTGGTGDDSLISGGVDTFFFGNDHGFDIVSGFEGGPDGDVFQFGGNIEPGDIFVTGLGVQFPGADGISGTFDDFFAGLVINTGEGSIAVPGFIFADAVFNQSVLSVFTFDFV